MIYEYAHLNYMYKKLFMEMYIWSTWFMKSPSEVHDLWKCPSEVHDLWKVHLKYMIYEYTHLKNMIYEKSIWSTWFMKMSI